VRNGKKKKLMFFTKHTNSFIFAACPSRRLPEDRMLFYAAEIVLAVDHLHEMGIIYRDLKVSERALRKRLDRRLHSLLN